MAVAPECCGDFRVEGLSHTLLCFPATGMAGGGGLSLGLFVWLNRRLFVCSSVSCGWGFWVCKKPNKGREIGLGAEGKSSLCANDEPGEGRGVWDP